MSEKRTSDESGVFQQENNAKRARLSSTSSTTLQDLPVELLERILVQVVPMEVKDMRMAKSVWKDKVDVVINRLEVVSSQWSSVLTTDVFRNEVNRILDGTAQVKIRLDMICQSPMLLAVIDLTTIKEEMFMLCGSSDQDCLINVYDLNNIEKVKEVILLPEIRAWSIVACSISNCLYVLHEKSNNLSVLRVTKDEQHQFNISPWISDLPLDDSSMYMYVSPNGSLILSFQQEPEPAELRIYNADGSLQHSIVLSSEKPYYVESVIMQNANGNLVVLSINQFLESELLELDMSGRIVRQHQPSTLDRSDRLIIGHFTDVHGRIFVHYLHDRIKLFDSEFNRMEVTGPRIYKGQNIDPKRWHYSSERNEIVSILTDDTVENGYLTTFRFAED